MPSAIRSRPRRGEVVAFVALVLLAGWLVGALLATAYGTVLLAPFNPCGRGSGCAALTMLVNEYAVRYGPLLLFIAVLTSAAARLMQHRDPLPLIAAGLAVVGALLATTMLIAAIAG